MKFALVFSIFLVSSPLFSQQYSNRELESKPYWINMINDSTTNYFEAVHAFEVFWSIRPLPKEEDDVLGNGEEYEKKEGFFDRLITTKKEKREAEAQQYAFDYKRFKQWQLRVEPWVREDGSITFPYEQLKIWNERE
ncbi:MAG: hypothetical protein ACHQFW_11460 [Chitinophagales bacterium]